METINFELQEEEERFDEYPYFERNSYENNEENNNNKNFIMLDDFLKPEQTSTYCSSKDTPENLENIR